MSIGSHKKVRDLMRNENVTAKELFLSRVFESHLEDIAASLSKRYRGFRKIRVKMIWDTSDGAPVAFTNDSLICINAGSPFALAKDVNEHYKNILGLFGHELGHILWTDFVAEMSYQNGIKNAVWFPNSPRLVNYDMKVNEKLFWDLMSQSEEHRNLALTLIGEVKNIVEDGFVDDQVMRAYPGVLGIGLRGVRGYHWTKLPEVEELIKKEQSGELKDHKLFSMFSILLQYAKYGEVKCDNIPLDDEHLVTLAKLMPLVDEYMQSSPRTRCSLTSEIVLVMFPYFKDLIEKQVQEQENNQNNGGDGSEQSGSGQGSGGQGSGGQGSGDSSQLTPSQASALSELIKNTVQGMAGNTQQAQGHTSACASVQKGGNTQAAQNRQKTASQIPASDEFKVSKASSDSGDGSDEENGAASGNISSDDGDEAEMSFGAQAQGGDEEDDGGEVPAGAPSDNNGKHFDGSGQKISSGEGACEDGQGSGQVEYNDEYEAQLDSNLAAKLSSLVDEIKEGRAIKTLEGERHCELNAFAKTVSYGNAHKGIDIRVNRASEITPYMEALYDEIAAPLLPIAKRIAKKYLEISDFARQGGRVDGLLMGKRFDAGAAYRKDGKVFIKNIMPQDLQPLAVALLIDESGSMSGERSQVAMATAIILQNFCEQLNIPIAIYGHSTSSYGCELYSYIEFDTYTKKDKYRLTDIGARGCNRDGAALRYTAERLMTRPEEAKVLILISDGQPNGDYGYNGELAKADLRGIQKEYTKKGVCFCAAAIGDDKDVIKDIYGDAFLDVSTLKQLPSKLMKVLEKYLKII